MELSINQLLDMEYVKLHATEDMAPEQIAELYDEAYNAITHRTSKG